MRITGKTADAIGNFVWTVSAGLLFGLAHVVTGWGFDSWKLWACAPVAITLGAIPMLVVAALLGDKVLTGKEALTMASKALDEASTPNEARQAFRTAAQLLPDGSHYLRRLSKLSDNEIMTKAKENARIIADDVAKMD